MRLAWQPANDLIGLVLALALPWLVCFTLFLLKRWWASTAAVGLILPLLFYSWIALVFGGDDVANEFNGRDPGFRLIAEVPWRSSTARAYRTDGGLAKDFMVIVRQERKVLPGVLAVRAVAEIDHCSSLELVSTNQGITITDHQGSCGGLAGGRREYHLTQFMYF